MNAIEPFVILGGCVIGSTAPKPVLNITTNSTTAINKTIEATKPPGKI